MGEQVDAKLLKQVKKTQDILGKHIKRPPLTDNNLMRPPFRFLHDLIMTTMNSTGFMKGAFSAKEMDAANLTTRELKTAFMTKVLQSIKEASGEKLEAKVSKILAGQEPEKTNDLLQALGKILDQLPPQAGGSEESAPKNPKAKKPVAKVSGTKVKEVPTVFSEASPYSTAKTPTGTKASTATKSTKPTEKDRKKPGTIRDASPAGKGAPTKAKSNAALNKPNASKTSSKEKRPAADAGDDIGPTFATEVEEDLVDNQESSLPHSATAGPSSLTGTGSRRGSLGKVSSGDAPAKQGSSKSTVPTGAASSIASTGKREEPAGEENNVSNIPESVAEIQKLPVGDPSPFVASSMLVDPAISPTVLVNDNNELEHDDNVDVDDDDTNDNGIVINTSPVSPNAYSNDLKPPTSVTPTPTPTGSNSAMNSRRRSPSSFGGLPLAPVVEDNKPAPTSEEPTIPASARPHTSQFRSSRPPTSARPPSARPAPPRPKSARFQEKEESFRPPTERVANVLLDSDEPDDENYVVHEISTTKAALTDLDETPELDIGAAGVKLDNEVDTLLPADQRGLLVNQILETQKELEEGGRQGGKKTEIERDSSLSDKDKLKSRESNALELEKLRNLIQMTAKSANPLGKLLDFIREDADAMHREMKKWQDESRILDKMIVAEQE